MLHPMGMKARQWEDKNLRPARCLMRKGDKMKDNRWDYFYEPHEQLILSWCLHGSEGNPDAFRYEVAIVLVR